MFLNFVGPVVIHLLVLQTYDRCMTDICFGTLEEYIVFIRVRVRYQKFNAAPYQLEVGQSWCMGY
jgi:hypothetical protein